MISEFYFICNSLNISDIEQPVDANPHYQFWANMPLNTFTSTFKEDLTPLEKKKLISRFSDSEKILKKLL